MKRSKYLQEDLDRIAQFLYDNSFGGSTIMITGATGLIGSLCVRAIVTYNQRYTPSINAIAIARSPEKVSTVFRYEYDNNYLGAVQFIYHDIISPIPENTKCDYIIHTASVTSSSSFMNKPVEVMDIIYSGTGNVLKFASNNRVKSIVFLSSMEVFGQVYSSQRCNEDDLGYISLQSIRSCYSEGKRAAELLCKCYYDEYGVPVKIGRLAQTFGAGILPSENRVFAQFARSVLNNEDIILHTKGMSIGNYCYTADAIIALFLLLKSGANGEAYNIVNEQVTMSIVDMANLVIQLLNNGQSKIIYDIPIHNEYGYAPDTGLKLSAAKIEALGWKPQHALDDFYIRMLPDLL